MRDVGEDQRRAVDAISEALDGKPLQPGAFRGLLAHAFEVDDRLALHRPLRPREFDELIKLPPSTSLDGWTWSKLFESSKEESRQNTGLFVWQPVGFRPRTAFGKDRVQAQKQTPAQGGVGRMDKLYRQSPCVPDGREQIGSG